MHLVSVIHGIRTKRTDVLWPKHFSPVLDGIDGVRCEAIYYRAGPWGWINTLILNPRLAKDLAQRVENRANRSDFKHSIVAHSNGADIAVLLIRRLAKLGIHTDTAILTGAAIQPDVERSGLLDLVSANHLGRAIAYSSPDDSAVKWAQRHPSRWGELGRRGFLRNGGKHGMRVQGYAPVKFPPRFMTRWFPGFYHGQYFDADERDACFRCILTDLGLT